MTRNSEIKCLQEFLTGVIAFVGFLYRAMDSGSLLARRWLEDVEMNECSERILSRLDARLIVDAAGVYIVDGIGIRDCLMSESLTELFKVRGETERSSPEIDESPIDCAFKDLKKEK